MQGALASFLRFVKIYLSNLSIYLFVCLFVYLSISYLPAYLYTIYTHLLLPIQRCSMCFKEYPPH